MPDPLAIPIAQQPLLMPPPRYGDLTALARWLEQGIEAGTYARLNDTARYNLRVLAMQMHEIAEREAPEPPRAKRRGWRFWR